MTKGISWSPEWKWSFFLFGRCGGAHGTSARREGRVCRKQEGLRPSPLEFCQVLEVMKASVSVSIVSVLPGSVRPSRILSMMSDIAGPAVNGKGEMLERKDGKV